MSEIFSSPLRMLQKRRIIWRNKSLLRRLVSVYLIISIVFPLFPLNLTKANHDSNIGLPQDTGWISADDFSGSDLGEECSDPAGFVWGQSDIYFWIEPSVLNLPAGHYSVDIEAHYGFYADDPQAPQTNETMTIRAGATSVNIPDLNGGGGERDDVDNCDQIRSNRSVYTNITGIPIYYDGVSQFFFEGQDANSQSITILKVRIHGVSVPPPTPPCAPVELITPTDGEIFTSNDNPQFQWQGTNRTFYILDISEDPNFSWWWNNGSGAGNGIQITSASFSDVENEYYAAGHSFPGTLEPGKTYYWRVYAYGYGSSPDPLNGADGCHSVIRSFSVSNNPPPPPPSSHHYSNNDGKIKVCIMLADEDGNIAVSSANLPPGSFTISLSTTTNITASTIGSKTWNTSSFSPNKQIIMPSEEDADCVSFSNLKIGEYFYSTLVVTGSQWLQPKYNDGYNQPVTSLSTFFTYTQELFDNNPSNDSLRNLNSDGHIVLNNSRKERKLVILVNYKKPINPPPTPPQVALTANPALITAGNFSTLSWSSTNATTCLAAWTTATSTSGAATVSPATTTTYSISCTGPGGSASATTTVQVVPNSNPIPSVSLMANPSSVMAGASTTLSWVGNNVSSCSAPWMSTTTISGSETLIPATTTDYFINCTGIYGNASATTTVVVLTPPVLTPPQVALTANPALITAGNFSTLSWSSTNATTCLAAWTTATSTSGAATVSPATTTTYSISCTGPGGSASATTTVQVTSGGGGGGGGGSSRVFSTPTECFYLRDYLRRDFNNDPLEVLKLQAFLRNFEGHHNLALTGEFDQATFDAVSAFQMKYYDDILAPWGHTSPTGYVYILTKKKVNEIYCQRLFALTDDQLKEISAFRTYLAELQAGANSGTTTGEIPPSSPLLDEVVGQVETPTTTTEEIVADIQIGESTEEIQQSGLRSIAASIISIPDDLRGIVECLYWFILILVVLYILGNVLKDVLYKNTPKEAYKRFLSKWMTIALGILLSIVISYRIDYWCLILPLLLFLVCVVLWILIYRKHNSIRASFKSWVLVLSARLKSLSTKRKNGESKIFGLDQKQNKSSANLAGDHLDKTLKHSAPLVGKESEKREKPDKNVEEQKKEKDSTSSPVNSGPKLNLTSPSSPLITSPKETPKK